MSKPSIGKSLAMMPWFPRDFIAATRHMTLAERGAYRDLLDFQWELGQLPIEHRRLCGLLSCSLDEFEQIWKTIGEKFIERNGALINERLEFHRKDALEMRDRKRAGAEKTNAQRYAQRTDSGSHSDTDSASLSGSPPSPSPSPSPSLSPSPSPAREKISRSLEKQDGHDRFQRCMLAYPKFSGRKNLIIAQKDAQAIVDEGRATWDLIEERTRAYAEFVKATSRPVMAPQSFYANDSDPPCLQEWEIVVDQRVTPGQKRTQSNVTAMRAAREAILAREGKKS